ncbi:MAG: hypothetical protein AAF962_08145 [Actinomycetota bacterium]
MRKKAGAGLRVGVNLIVLGGTCVLLLLNVVSGPLFYQGLFMGNGGQQVDGTIPGPWLIVPFLALLLAGAVVLAAAILWGCYVLAMLLWPGRDATAGLTVLVFAFAAVALVASVWFHVRIYTTIVDRDPFWGLS